MRWVGLSALAVISSLVVFAPGLRAGFVSDAWIFIAGAQRPWSELLAVLAPSDPVLWRPAVSLGFWIEYRLFGLDPLGYHLVALAAHLGSAVLVGAIAWHLTRHRVAAAVAAVAFAFTLHAHEVVYDVADLHNAVGGPLLLGAVLAFIRGSPGLAAGLTATAFLVDEAAVLVLPLTGLYTLLWGGGRWRDMARRVAPVAVVVGLYLGWRALGGVGEYVADPCRAPGCLLRGGAEYLGRLIARPDVLLERRLVSFLSGATALTAVTVALRPRRWRHTRPMAFGAGWAAGSSLLFVLALYPYVADRFLYIPSMGLAIVIAGAVAELEARWHEGHRYVAAAVGIGLAAWIVTGAAMLHQRGEAWTAAGDRALGIVAQIVAEHPNPPPETTLVVAGVPHSLDPFPPGNTGPYVFHNGLPQALSLAYGRRDISVVRAGRPIPAYTTPVYRLEVE